MNSKSIYIPYTYLIGWTEHNRWYYGSKFGKDANPETFWVTYHTSSKFVESFREQHGEPDIIQIRRTFTTAEETIAWESKVLARLDVMHQNHWLNCHNNSAIRSMPGELNPMKRSDVKKKHKESVNTPEYKQLMSEKVTGRIHKEETKKQMSETALKNGTGKWNKGVKKSEEWKKKNSNIALQRPRKLCPKCNQGYTQANYKRHYNSCKGIIQDQYKKCPDGIVRRVKAIHQIQ